MKCIYYIWDSINGKYIDLEKYDLPGLELKTIKYNVKNMSDIE